MVRHESWDTRSATRFFIYNQFNNLNVREELRERLNLGIERDTNGVVTSYGTGMAQITDNAWRFRSDVSWNWKTNLLAMNAIMSEIEPTIGDLLAISATRIKRRRCGRNPLPPTRYRT